MFVYLGKKRTTGNSSRGPEQRAPLGHLSVQFFPIHFVGEGTESMNSFVILVASNGNAKISRTSLEACGYFGLSAVTAMLPIGEHFKKDCGRQLRSYERHRDDTVRRYWSPTEQSLQYLCQEALFPPGQEDTVGFLQDEENSFYKKLYKIMFSAANLRKMYSSLPHPLQNNFCHSHI